jgi:hypothetical protein
VKAARVRATGVIVRFLSLLDVIILHLGVLMLALMHAQLRSDARRGGSPVGGMSELASVDFVYLYAGWKGPENGRCYLLSANREIGREVRTGTADDIQEVLTARRAQKERANQVVMLLFSDDGWYSAWDSKRLAGIEQTWRIKVIPVYNVRLSR